MRNNYHRFWLKAWGENAAKGGSLGGVMGPNQCFDVCDKKSVDCSQPQHTPSDLVNINTWPWLCRENHQKTADKYRDVPYTLLKQSATSQFLKSLILRTIWFLLSCCITYDERALGIQELRKGWHRMREKHRSKQPRPREVSARQRWASESRTSGLKCRSRAGLSGSAGFKGWIKLLIQNPGRKSLSAGQEDKESMQQRNELIGKTE